MTKAQRNELEYIQMAKGVTYFLARNNPAKVSMLKRMAAKNYITFTEEPAGIADCYITELGRTELATAPGSEDANDE